MTDFLAEQNSLMEKITRDYGGLIRGAVHKVTDGRTGSDDIVSEVYLAILLTLRKFGTGWTPPRSFIFTVVRNKVNDFLRQKYREKKGIGEVRKHLEARAVQKGEVVSRIHSLTAGEFRVFRLLGLGLTNSEMAESLHVSIYTVRSHIKKIHAKCGVKNRAKLTLIAYMACSRERSESREEESEAGKPPQPRGRGAQSLPGRGHPELWDPAPPSPPVAVRTQVRYLS